MTVPVSLIFGGAGGIGSAVARMLHAESHTIILAGRTPEKLAAVAETIPGATSIVCDAVDGSATTQCLEAVLAQHGRLDTVVHAVGSVLLKPAHLTSEAEFQEIVSKNLVSAFNVTRSVGKLLHNPASVIFFSSCAAQVGLSNHEAIAAAKAGIEGLIRSAAATYAARGVRFNCIAPGLTKTPMTAAITSNPSAESYSRALHPLGRLGEPEDIAATVGFLASPAAAWITGQVFGVDGGLSRIKQGTTR